jgi:hypothetical protein
MRVKAMAAVSVTSVFLVSCVTINIYFPAAAAEKAADKIIEEVWQLKKDGGAAGETKPPAAEEKKQ